MVCGWSSPSSSSSVGNWVFFGGSPGRAGDIYNRREQFVISITER
jgi:hypothetical protein